MLEDHSTSTTLFDPNVDEIIQYHADMEYEWQELVAAGPASINYVYALMTMASRGDFSFSKDFDYQLIKYPESFHTTLVEVANYMHTALYNVHISME